MTIDAERATERAILRLELTIEVRDETIRELRTQVSALERRAESVTRELIEALASRPATIAASVPGPHAGAQQPQGGPILGPKAQGAISKYAGRNKLLGQQLTEAALGELLINPELTDDELAAKIIDGESPDSDSDDEAIEVARGRVIPGGGAD